MSRHRLASLLPAFGLVACAEVAEPASEPIPEAGLDATTDTTSAVDATTGPESPSDAGSPSGPLGGLIINELRASGEDWVELLNAGAIPLALSGLRVADLDEATGAPKLAEAITLPAGTTLGPGARLVIVADVATPREGLQTDCLGGAVATCLEAPYGLSGPRGDRVFILSATTDDVLVEAAYPAPAEASVPDGQSWGRLPDGTGAFGPATPTPGAANLAP